jgi:malonyl-CoA/methylmalonyl-CoA synthetase
MARLLDSLAHPPDRIALHDADGTYDWATVAARADDVAAALGDRRGTRVGVLAAPGMPFVAALFGIWRAGGTGVVLSPLHPAIESRFFVQDAGIRTLLVTPDQRPRAEAIGGTELVDLTTLARVAPPAPGFEPLPSDPALMLYTSGTTGKPKGALLTHANLAMQQALLREAWGWSPADELLHVLPLHHMHGLCIALLSALGAGAAVRMLPAFDAGRVFREMKRATVFMAVPTIYAKLLAAFDAASPTEQAEWSANARALRLATSGSAALPVTLAERWRELTGTIPLERFGMTEIGVGISNPLVGERRAGTVGLPLPTVETRIVGDDGEAAASGELWIRGPSVFPGYFERPDATRAAFAHDGWFKTGDTVTRDEAGYFKILGRTSVDILKSGGYKLSALEIEEVLREHAAVKDVAVVGVPDPTWGERVVACVELRGAVTEGELRAFAKEKLASYKCPKEVHFFDALPRNAMGKVQKPELVRGFAAPK